jgi:hypothetical protein
MDVQEELLNGNLLGYDMSTIVAGEVEENRELNFMGAKNFKLPALLRLYVVFASGIIGEPQYYRDSKDIKTSVIKYSGLSKIDSQLLMFPENAGKTSNDIYMETLKNALDADFEQTLCFASTLRNEYGMRLGPQIILVEAAQHVSRPNFNQNHPAIFRNVAKQVIQIPTDLKSQMEYFAKTYREKGVKIPSILKLCWKDALERFSKYQYSKYAVANKLVDAVRLSHPRSDKNPAIKELVLNGKVVVEEQDSTWEKMRSSGKSWKDIYGALGRSFPHMALLRNLRNMSNEFSVDEMETVMNQLVQGVARGKQFPFRYYTAHQQFQEGYAPTNTSAPTRGGRSRGRGVSIVASKGKTPSKTDEGWKWKAWRENKKRKQNLDELVPVVEVVVPEPVIEQKQNDPPVIALNTNMRSCIQNGLERCMKKAVENMPSLKGRVVCLSDNSGSAHGAFQSEYGSQSVASIGNLSSIITAMGATEGGEIGIFGDRLHMYKVSKERGIIEQLEEVNNIGKQIGQSTENGIWIWFKEQYENKNKDDQKVDHLFVYSDIQCGHGGLYGIGNDYKDFTCHGRYIDVIKLITRHREKVNGSLNVFTIQTAGYDNSLIPETLHRTAILAGWSGNELSYAHEMINIWDAL